jgi:hypothetical protein
MRVPGTDTSEPHLRPWRAGEQPVRSAEFIRTNLERSALDVDRHQFSGIPRTEPGLDFLLLILQLHMLLSPGSIVVKSCSGLMSSAPAGPRQDFICGCIGVQGQAHEQPSNLGHSEGNQFNGATGPPFSAFARCTARNAWANIARVMKRYHAAPSRTSY